LASIYIHFHSIHPTDSGKLTDKALLRMAKAINAADTDSFENDRIAVSKQLP
jgi:hypothetical protein